jgi:hypothetical protein
MKSAAGPISVAHDDIAIGAERMGMGGRFGERSVGRDLPLERLARVSPQLT